MPLFTTVKGDWGNIYATHPQNALDKRGVPLHSETYGGSTFPDRIGGETVGFAATPTPVCGGADTPVQHWGQEWYISGA